MKINQLLSPLGPDNQPLTVEQLRLLFNQQLEHYVQETEAFKEENQLLKDQLVLEKNARKQAKVSDTTNYACSKLYENQIR